MMERIHVAYRARLVKTLLSHLTAAVLLLHMVCGGCWHHLASPNCHDVHPTALEAAHCHEHHSPHSDPSEHPNGDHHPSHPCSDIRCMYTTVAAPRHQETLCLTGFVACHSMTWTADAQTSASACSVSYAASMNAVAPPLRLHLAHQLLLI
jgi:hypothetical protein